MNVRLFHDLSPQQLSAGYWKETDDFMPSPELVYLIGSRLTDGFACKVSGKQYIVGLKVKDRDFAERFHYCLTIVMPGHKLYFQSNQGYWRVIIYSKKLFLFLKSKHLHDYLMVVKDYPTDFIRSIADAEGCPFIHDKKYGYIRVKISNTDLELLEFTKVILDEVFGIKSKIRPEEGNEKTKKQLYSLFITRNIDVATFAKMIGFSIERKMRRTERVFEAQKRMLHQMKLYKKTVTLHGNGLGYRRIAKKLGIPRSTVTGWIQGRYSPIYVKEGVEAN